MEKYFVADSYINFEFDVDKAYKNNYGKLVVDAKNKCDRCNGSGIAISHIENGCPIPYMNDGGICYACNGKGIFVKTIRLYTEKEKAAAARAKERAAERKVEQKLAAAEQKKAEWLEREGFGEQGTTTIYIAEDSYSRKDELKANGWKYSTFIGWHTSFENAHKDNLYPDESLVTLSWEDLVSFNIYGEGFWLSRAKAYVDSIKEAHKPKSASEWVGLEKEKISNLSVVVKRITGFQGQFGWTSVVTFLHNENELVWMTSTGLKFAEGDHLSMSATVKEHKDYKGTKQTVVKNCKFK